MEGEVKRAKSMAALNKASIAHTKYSDVMQCPHRIMYRGHYNPDGSCRCFDPFHKFMIDWGFEWDKNRQVWMPKPEEDK